MTSTDHTLRYDRINRAISIFYTSLRLVSKFDNVDFPVSLPMENLGHDFINRNYFQVVLNMPQLIIELSPTIPPPLSHELG